MTSAEQNKAVVRRFLSGAVVEGNSGVLDEQLAPNYVNAMMPGSISTAARSLRMTR